MVLRLTLGSLAHTSTQTLGKIETRWFSTTEHHLVNGLGITPMTPSYETAQVLPSESLTLLHENRLTNSNV